MIKGENGSPFNLLSIVLLGLTLLVCACYGTLFFVPSLAGPLAGPTRAALLPTSTPTIPGPPTLPATWTPTATDTPVDTPVPVTPSDTPTPTPIRDTITPIPTRTRTVTPGPSPTASPTRSKYPFTAEITYQPSPINPCGSTYVLGTITDLAGKPVTGQDFVIHVEGDADVDTGNALHPGEQFRGKGVKGPSPFAGLGFGPSAWSVAINYSGTSAGVWTVWLIHAGQASDRIPVQLQSSCAYSSAIVRFQQNH